MLLQPSTQHTASTAWKPSSQFMLRLNNGRSSRPPSGYVILICKEFLPSFHHLRNSLSSPLPPLPSSFAIYPPETRTELSTCPSASRRFYTKSRALNQIFGVWHQAEKYACELNINIHFSLVITRSFIAQTHTFEFVWHFLKCDTVAVSQNQIIIIISIICYRLGSHSLYSYVQVPHW